VRVKLLLHKRGWWGGSGEGRESAGDLLKDGEERVVWVEEDRRSMFIFDPV